MKIKKFLLLFLIFFNFQFSFSLNNKNIFPWFISIHAWEVQYSLNITEKAFQIAKELGIKGIRTDVFWFDIEPQKDIWDLKNLNFYKSFFQKAKEFNLDSLIILNGPPEWAFNLYKFINRTEFWERYQIYSQKILNEFSNLSNKFQLWNEVGFHNPIDGDDIFQLFTIPGSLIKEYNKNFITFVNTAFYPMWDSNVTQWLLQAGKFIDVIGIDYYPGIGENWDPLELIIQRINQINSPWYGKYGAILETGFSTWNNVSSNENDQKLWIEKSLPIVRKLVFSNIHNRRQKFKIIMGNYYQLIDLNDNYGPINPSEHHFGILHQNLSPKLGFPSLKKEISLWSF